MTEEDPNEPSTSSRNAVRTVIVSLAERNTSAKAMFDKFFDWYPEIWFVNDEIVSTLNNMPRPLREIAVTHQAFGMMSNGGLPSYYLHFETLFDKELMQGLDELGFAGAYAPIAEGRELFNASPDGELSIEESAKIYGQLPSLQEVENRIGKWLIREFKSFSEH